MKWPGVTVELVALQESWSGNERYEGVVEWSLSGLDNSESSSLTVLVLDVLLRLVRLVRLLLLGILMIFGSEKGSAGLCRDAGCVVAMRKVCVLEAAEVRLKFVAMLVNMCPNIPVATKGEVESKIIRSSSKCFKTGA